MSSLSLSFSLSCNKPTEFHFSAREINFGSIPILSESIYKLSVRNVSDSSIYLRTLPVAPSSVNGEGEDSKCRVQVKHVNIKTRPGLSTTIEITLQALSLGDVKREICIATASETFTFPLIAKVLSPSDYKKLKNICESMGK